MKKILTFLVMLLISGSTLMAQNEPQEVQMPKFRYQAVLRDANNVLVANQSGTVTIKLNEVTWVSDQEFTTNANGLVSLDLDYESLDVNPDHNWNGDTLVAEFNVAGQTIILNTPVAAVPYAIQAGDVRITTPMLTDYFERAVPEDVDRVYQALLNNPTFSQACRDSAVNYIKENYTIAKEIAYDYLSKVSKQDVEDIYDSMRIVDIAVRQAFYDLVKDYIKNHRALLVDVAKYYISTADVQEAEELYTSFESSTAAPAVRRILLDYFAQYLRGKHLICDNQDWTLCSAAAYVSGNIVCPQINSVQGSRYGTPQGNDLIDLTKIEFQVNIDDMGVVDLSTLTVKVTYTKGQETETKELQLVDNVFSLELGPNDGIEQINANVGFDIQLVSPGCSEIQQHGSFTNVPNN